VILPVERVTIASVVEGHGEVKALPRLLYRVAHEVSVWSLYVTPPLRVNRGKLVAPGGVERAVMAMSLRTSGAGGVLVVLDADDNCPAHLGPELAARAQGARPDVRVAVVLAKREFEAWFLAAAGSLAGHHGLDAQLVAPDNAEEIRGAKEWLSAHRSDGHPYKPTIDQAGLVSVLDLRQARANSPSFGKFLRETEALLRTDPVIS
jgi:hypothetical protein